MMGLDFKAVFFPTLLKFGTSVMLGFKNSLDGKYYLNTTKLFKNQFQPVCNLLWSGIVEDKCRDAPFAGICLCCLDFEYI